VDNEKKKKRREEEGGGGFSKRKKGLKREDGHIPQKILKNFVHNLTFFTVNFYREEESSTVLFYGHFYFLLVSLLKFLP
jgi:hypothetical protein